MVWVKGQEAELADDLKEVALVYHQFPTPGKISVTPIKDLSNQRDLALAYSPGVAAASELIAETPEEAVNMTARGNLVGVISNGTAVLGLGGHRTTCLQARHGREGGVVQEVRRNRCF